MKEKIYSVILIVVLVWVFLNLASVLKTKNSAFEKCQAKNGYLVELKNRSLKYQEVCIKSEAVIDINVGN
jgi:hypothetical protein